MGLTLFYNARHEKGKKEKNIMARCPKSLKESFTKEKHYLVESRHLNKD